jgi:hypothetical protein
MTAVHGFSGKDRATFWPSRHTETRRWRRRCTYAQCADSMCLGPVPGPRHHRTQDRHDACPAGVESRRCEGRAYAQIRETHPDEPANNAAGRCCWSRTTEDNCGAICSLKALRLSQTISERGCPLWSIEQESNRCRTLNSVSASGTEPVVVRGLNEQGKHGRRSRYSSSEVSDMGQPHRRARGKRRTGNRRMFADLTDSATLT